MHCLVRRPGCVGTWSSKATVTDQSINCGDDSFSSRQSCFVANTIGRHIIFRTRDQQNGLPSTILRVDLGGCLQDLPDTGKSRLAISAQGCVAKFGIGHPLHPAGLVGACRVSAQPSLMQSNCKSCKRSHSHWEGGQSMGYHDTKSHARTHCRKQRP